MKVTPAASLQGTIELPGDKSISHRAAIIAAIADGETEIVGAECADVSFPGFFETLASVVKS